MDYFYHMPSTFQSLTYIGYNLLSFLLLAWYCDHVFPNNRGSTESALFFLTPSYWGYKCKNSPTNLSNTVNKTRLNSDEIS